MSTRTFTDDELNEYYNSGRIHHQEIINVEPDEVTYTAVLDAAMVGTTSWFTLKSFLMA